jgi:hypothetical protein
MILPSKFNVKLRSGFPKISRGGPIFRSWGGGDFFSGGGGVPTPYQHPVAMYDGRQTQYMAAYLHSAPCCTPWVEFPVKCPIKQLTIIENNRKSENIDFFLENWEN